MKNFSGYTFCFLGRSGAGKDSQAFFWKDFLNKSGYKTLVVSTGDEGRKLIAKDTAVGRWLKGILDAGHFFPDQLAISLWLSVVQNELYQEDVLLFCGNPRRVVEAQVLDDITKGTHRPMTIPVYLDISEDEARRRLLKRGRGDDNLVAINERLKSFINQALPMIDYYGSRVVRIDGNGTQKEVSQRLMEKLKSL